MTKRFSLIALALLGLSACDDNDNDTPPVVTPEPAPAKVDIKLSVLGRYSAGVIGESAAEIVDFDPASKQLFVINAAAGTVDVLDAANPATPTKTATLDVAALIGEAIGGVNSVAVKNGLVAVAVENDNKQAAGYIAFYKADGLQALGFVGAGALPDMVTFSPDGRYVLSANEGEPNAAYDNDPEGSVTLVDLGEDPLAKAASLKPEDVKQLNFNAFDAQKDSLMASGVRVFGPNASVSQDLEPEYIAVSSDSTKAYVTLQENNAMAVVDLASASITGISALGFKDHSLAGNGLDASDKDDAINIKTWPVMGMYMPDSVASFTVDGVTYLVTANEGDSRDYDGFSEEARVKDLELDPEVFADASLQDSANLGRLQVTTTLGQDATTGLYSQLYSFGGRSFSVWKDEGGVVSQVWDSGDAFEQYLAEALPEDFNSDNEEQDSFDSRSDNKGPEPEGIAVGTIGEQHFAFVGLERIGGIMVYDVTDPAAPVFQDYINSRDFAAQPLEAAGDLGPEGVHFVSAEDSPSGEPMLIVGHEVSGTTVLYQIATSPRS